jgi:hypothetical protein
MLVSAVIHLTEIRKRRLERGNQREANAFERGLSFYLRAIVGLYTFLISVGLSPFRCYPQEDGTYTLVPSSSLNCYDKNWASHWFTIGVGLSQLIAVPCFLIGLFWKYNNPELRQQNKFLWRYGMITRSFKPQFFWWSLLLLFKKTCLVMFIDLTNSYSPYIRVGLTLIVIFLAMTIDGFCKPYVVEGISAVVFLR